MRQMYVNSVVRIYGFMVVLSTHLNFTQVGRLDVYERDLISQPARSTLQQSNVQRKGSPFVGPLWTFAFGGMLALQSKCCKHQRYMSCSSILRTLNIHEYSVYAIVGTSCRVAHLVPGVQPNSLSSLFSRCFGYSSWWSQDVTTCLLNWIINSEKSFIVLRLRAVKASCLGDEIQISVHKSG